MEQWQDVASQQLKLLTNNLNELLTKGLGLLRSELGVDLGLKPELIPPWVILLAVCSGLVLMVALWASVCLAIFKKRPALSPEDDGIEVKLGAVKPVKSEEPKKKRKRTERKTQSNGRAVAEAQEEVLQAEETVPHQQSPPSEVKIEKVAEGKKSKKKAKQAGKETKTVTADRKEPEEGTWETKVSNKEKREQRKKDKGSSDGSASPGGGNTPVSSPPEQPKASAGPPPVSQKKKKGESTKAKPEKVEVVAPQVNSEVAAVTAGATALTVKVPARTIHKKTDTWKASREPAPLLCGDIDESWTMVEKGMTTSQSGLSAEPVRERPWLSQPKLDDEWSGLNGGSVDPTSDWNAPSEVWGNYEEPTPAPPPSQEQPLPEPTKVNLLIGEADDDEEEKDKGEGSADGVAKAKKKKKKKKKVAEEAAGQREEPRKEVIPVVSMKKQPPRQESSAAVQPIKVALVETRVEQPVKEITSQKPLITQVPLKPTDEKPEESQAPKPAKKKKARRET